MHNPPPVVHLPRARPDLTFRPAQGHLTLTDGVGAQTSASAWWSPSAGPTATGPTAEAVARELPGAEDDVQAGVTALLARYRRDCHQASRLVQVCDVYDAPRTRRPYREAWPSTQALEYITERAGAEFDLAMAQAFRSMMRRWDTRIAIEQLD